MRVAVGVAVLATVAAVAARAGGAELESRAAPIRACPPHMLHAVIGGRHQCLTDGMRCRPRLDRAYHRYLFHCHGGKLEDAWDLLQRRPLHVPTLEPGSACPRAGAQGTLADVGMPRLPGWPAWGRGPAYPMRGGDAAAGLVLSFDPLPETGWGADKVMWAVGPRYHGPVLVRGRQLDGPNHVRFANGKLAWYEDAELRLNGPETWGNPALTLVRVPGCYAYQVDGRRFSYLIVFEARIGR